MKIEQLTKIIRTADKKAITKQLKELNYIDYKKHKEYAKISLATLFNSDLQETEVPRQKRKMPLSGRYNHAG